MTASTILKRVWLSQGTLTSEEYFQIESAYRKEFPSGNPEEMTALEMTLALLGKLEAWHNAGKPTFHEFKKFAMRELPSLT